MLAIFIQITGLPNFFTIEQLLIDCDWPFFEYVHSVLWYNTTSLPLLRRYGVHCLCYSARTQNRSSERVAIIDNDSVYFIEVGCQKPCFIDSIIPLLEKLLD